MTKLSIGANDFGRFGLAAAVVARSAATLSDALTTVRFFRWFVLAPRITAAPAVVLPFGLSALNDRFKADQSSAMAPGTFDCVGHLREVDRRCGRAKDQGNTDCECTELAVDCALPVSGATLGLVRKVGHVERLAAGEAAPVIVALLHRRADRARGFTLWTGLISRATHRSQVSDNAGSSLLAAFGGRSFQEAGEGRLGIFRDDEALVFANTLAGFLSRFRHDPSNDRLESAPAGVRTRTTWMVTRVQGGPVCQFQHGGTKRPLKQEMPERPLVRLGGVTTPPVSSLERAVSAAQLSLWLAS